MGWGRVAADGSESGEIGSEGNRLLVGREALGPIADQSASDDLTIYRGKEDVPPWIWCRSPWNLGHLSEPHQGR